MFNPENWFWSSIARLVDIVGLSILWALLCIPVVTIGPATAALYYTVVKAFRQGEESTFGTMLRAFRENLRRGIPATLLCIAAAAFIGGGYYVMVQNRGTAPGFFMYCVFCAAMLLPAGMLCCIFPLLGRFNLGLKALFRTALQLTLAHAPTMVLLVLLNLSAAVLTVFYSYLLFFLPVLLTLSATYLLERVFAKHLTEAERAKLQNRPEEDNSGES